MAKSKTATKEERAIAGDEAQIRSLSTGEVLREIGLCPLVVVRCYGAGVHVGHAARVVGTEVELLDARRIWRWTGRANTLHEMSRTGIAKDSRVSQPVKQILLSSAMEVLPVEEAAVSSLTTSNWT